MGMPVDGERSGPRIVGCAIVRDEARFLSEALVSMRSLCDRIVVVDTGSRDDTRRIAAEGADVVADLPFDDDFSAARNHALSLVDRADWILFLDADERLLPAEAAALRTLIAQTPPEVGGLRLTRFNFFPTGGFYVSDELRVFRFRPDVRFEGTVGESVSGALHRADLRVESVPVLLTHVGHCRPRVERDRKARRYIAAMQAEVADGSGRPLLLGYVGVNLRILGEVGEARKWTERALRAEPDNPTLWMFHGHVLRATEEPDVALEAYHHGVELSGGRHPALLTMAGLCHAAAGRPDRAAELFQRVLDLSPHRVHALINLGMLAEAQGDYERAEQLYTRAGERYPDLFVEEPAGRLDFESFYTMMYDTPATYAGLARHLAFARAARSGGVIPRAVTVGPLRRGPAEAAATSS
jgi:tetratricopeptide (TPR) repeat protein